MPPNEQGELIKACRTARLWSVRRLAREAHLSAGYISQLEKGNRPVTPRALGAIADGLGLPPYELLTKGGFIPAEHLERAELSAERALHVPTIVSAARGETDAQKLDWLIVDYLYLLGDDPYGTGWEGGPGGNHADWTALLPDAPPPITDRLLREAMEWKASLPRGSASPIEGWDELSEADRVFVQQMVNKLRRPATGE